MHNVIFENGGGGNISFPKYPAMYKRGLKLSARNNFFKVFPPMGAVWFDMIRCGTVRASTTRSGRGPDLAVISHTYISVLLSWGAKTFERVPTSLSYTRCPLIGQQNCHFRATGG